MKELKKAVLEQAGMSEDELASDVFDASNGYGGFIYYKDTCEFYAKNKDLIWEKLEEDAEGYGTSILQMVADFGGAKNVSSADTFENLLAWYALESVANDIRAEKEE